MNLNDLKSLAGDILNHFEQGDAYFTEEYVDEQMAELLPVLQRHLDHLGDDE